MYTHVVCWNFKDEVEEEDKPTLKAAMKENFATLPGKVPGLLTVTFVDEPLPGSTREIGLVTTHEKMEDIAAYGKHPAHVAVADKYVRPYTKDRACLNF